MDHYRRRFWQKGVIASIREENLGEALETGTGSQAVHQTGFDTPSQSEDYSSSDESSYEMLQGAPPIGSKAIPEKVFCQKDPSEDHTAEAIDLEVLDPALRPPVEKDCTKREESDNLWQQRSKLSQSPAVIFQRGASVPCITPNGMFAFEGLRSSSVPQEPAFKAQTPSIPSHGVEWRTNSIEDADVDDHKVAIEGETPVSALQNSQIMLSTHVGNITKGAKMSKGGQTLHQITQKTFDSSYDFSDEEDEIKLVEPRRPFRLQVPEAAASRRHVKKQIIDLTIEDSVPANDIALDRRALKSPTRNCHQESVSISPVSDLIEFEEEKFFLEPTTPKPSVSDSNTTLSGILGPDDFAGLRESSPVSRQFPEEKTTNPASKEIRVGVRSSPSCNPTPKRRTPVNTTRANTLRRSTEASPSCPMMQTPGGSRRRCGENGFRCGRGFCFKCLEG